MPSRTQSDQLNEIAQRLRVINNTLCCGNSGATPTTYNTIAQYNETSDPGPTDITIPADTVHSISLIVTVGTVDVTFEGITAPLTYSAGESFSVQADQLVSNSTTISPASGAEYKLLTLS